jgi:hypothetical protein
VRLLSLVRPPSRLRVLPRVRPLSLVRPLSRLRVLSPVRLRWRSWLLPVSHSLSWSKSPSTSQ